MATKQIKHLLGLTLGLGIGLGVGFVARGLFMKKHSELKTERLVSAEQSCQILKRAIAFLRIPTSNKPPEVLSDGTGLRCPETGKVYSYHEGVLDLLENNLNLTVTQQFLDTPFTAWMYDYFRKTITQMLSIPDFATEVTMLQNNIQSRNGDVILDLACGQGNFTVELAKRVGKEGLIIGIDISSAMLSRATQHVKQWGLDNVLLIRGDAHHLPLAQECLNKVNCSGGFHQFPNLLRALREIARVSTPGAILTASTFATEPADKRANIKKWLKRYFDLHFVPLSWMGEKLAEIGYKDYSWSLCGGWFGYTTAHKRI